MSTSIAHFIYLDRAQTAASVAQHHRAISEFRPGAAGTLAGADVLFSLFSDHSWGCLLLPW